MTQGRKGLGSGCFCGEVPPRGLPPPPEGTAGWDTGCRATRPSSDGREGRGAPAPLTPTPPVGRGRGSGRRGSLDRCLHQLPAWTRRPGSRRLEPACHSGSPERVQRGREAWGGWRRGGPAAPGSNLPSSALRPAHLRGSLPSRRHGTSPLTQQSPCASHPTRPLRGAGTVSTWEETRHVAAGGTLPLARHVAAGELCETETLLAPPTVLCKLGV